VSERLGSLNFSLALVTKKKLHWPLCGIKYLIFLNTKYVLRLHCGSNWWRHKTLIIYVRGYYRNFAIVWP